MSRARDEEVARPAPDQEGLVARTKWALEMDYRATDLLLAAEALLKDETLQPDTRYRVQLALEDKVRLWREAVAGYAESGGMRRDTGGLVRPVPDDLDVPYTVDMTTPEDAKKVLITLTPRQLRAGIVRT